MKKPTYLGLYQNGYLDCTAQIHEWHDNNNLTVEYLSYLDMIVFVSTGREPSFTPVNVENTADVTLDDLPKGYSTYKLHYTWLTIARDFAAAEKHFNDQ